MVATEEETFKNWGRLYSEEVKMGQKDPSHQELSLDKDYLLMVSMEGNTTRKEIKGDITEQNEFVGMAGQKQRDSENNIM